MWRRVNASQSGFPLTTYKHVRRKQRPFSFPLLCESWPIPSFRSHGNELFIAFVTEKGGDNDFIVRPHMNREPLRTSIFRVHTTPFRLPDSTKTKERPVPSLQFA